MRTILLRGARQLLTLRGEAGPRRGAALKELAIIQDGAVLIRDGVILEVNSTRRVENLAIARGAREIDATGCVVMPGFVDSHTHLVYGHTRLTDYEMRLSGASYEEIARAGGGILSSVRSVRSQPGSRLRMQARKALEGFLQHGTTSVEAKSGYGLDESAELKTLRVIARMKGLPIDLAPTYLGAHVTPPEYEGNADAYIDWTRERVLPLVARRKLARFADVYCEPGAFTVQQARRYLESARALGLGLKIHAEQFVRSGGAQLAVELGAVSADHLEQANDADVKALAASDTIATLLPGSVFFLGLSRFAPARALIDAGAAVALATDYNPGTSPSLSMAMTLSLACSQMRMSPAEAISAATINGAYAAGLAKRAGSIAPDKQADLVVFRIADYREIPYHFGVNLVQMTIKRGEIVYEQPRIKWPEN